MLRSCCGGKGVRDLDAMLNDRVAVRSGSRMSRVANMIAEDPAAAPVVCDDVLPREHLYKVSRNICN